MEDNQKEADDQEEKPERFLQKRNHNNVNKPTRKLILIIKNAYGKFNKLQQNFKTTRY